jgi:hypothetical protein
VKPRTTRRLAFAFLVVVSLVLIAVSVAAWRWARESNEQTHVMEIAAPK